ncbi:MAG: hypothetical protein JNK61_06725 [Bacteroidia bacterium]|nr:hypothetical protein [Bacteroidia bacterium]
MDALHNQIGWVFLILIISIFVLLVIGHVVKALLGLASADKTGYYALLTGTVFFVLFSATILSCSKTIMLGFVLIFVFLNNKPYKIKWPSINNVLHVVIIASAFFTIQYLTIFNGNELPLLPEGDALYYARLASKMAETGIENTNLYGNEGREPYHYFDLWITATLIKFTKFNPYLILKLIVYPILLTILYAGYFLWACSKNLSKLNSALLALLLCFFSGFYLLAFDKINYVNDSVLFFYSAITYPKLLVIYIFIQAAFISYISKNNFNAITWLACLPLCFITVVPVYSALLCILILLIALKLTSVKWQQVLPAVFIVVFILIFYLLQPVSTTINGDKINSVDSFFSLKYFVTAFNIFLVTVAQFVIAYSIWIVIALWLLYKCADSAFKQATLMYCTGFAFALFIWAVLHQIMDSVQLFFNFIIPATAIFCFYILLQVIEYKKKVFFAVALLLLGFRVLQFFHFNGIKTNPYSKTYTDYVSRQIDGKNMVAASIINGVSYDRIFAKNTQFRVNDAYLYYINPTYKCHAISVMDGYNAKGNKALEKLFVEQSVFYQFVQHQKATGVFQDIAQSQIDFIKEKKIKLVFVNKGSYVADSIIALADTTLTDTGTGETLLMLSY